MAGIVLFDFDGTLARRPWISFGRIMLDVIRQEDPDTGVTTSDLWAGLEDGFPWHHPEVSHPELNGHPDAWWARLEPVLLMACIYAGVDLPLAERAVAAVRPRFSDPTEWELFPETVDALEALQEEGWRLAIVSNAVPELTRIVEGLGIAPYFDAIIASAEVGYEKGHPEIFRIALRALGEATPSDPVWMVGDNVEADIEAATRLGFGAVLVHAEGEGGVAHDLRDAAYIILMAAERA
ncbi:HAD family hydrolase [Gryllotalpicola ginsengisoli]|uniref:HAD family hydrolase n=1 Tax=Gryllotalpicola ginsengisoli TaxID=444608 RepID=UPI0003B7204D|nr:HAD-IA family hydrolase [Gryllotalpicola ginsengisoli]